MPSRSHALLLGLLAVASTGCELVFGLDDYARAPAGAGGGATTASTSTGDGGATGGDGGGGAVTTTTSSTAGGGDGGSTSSSNPGCPCVPDGWTLTTAFPLGATPGDPRVCSNNLTADRARENPSVACTCACGTKPELDCSLVCWGQPNCTDDEPRVLSDTGIDCTGLSPVVRSCAIAVVQGGEPIADVCTLSETAVVTASNELDLCSGGVPDAACGGAGVCAPPPPEALWCIRGPAGAECPADWPDDRDVLVGGSPDCACDCIDAVTCDAGTFDGFLVARGGSCIDQVTDVSSRDCTSTGDAGRYVGNAPGLDGGCVAQEEALAGAVVGADAERLCCRP